MTKEAKLRASTASEDKMLLDFSYLHAVFIVGAVLTYLVDLTLDIILATTYIYDGYYWYALITLFFVFMPTIIVQIFSIRWHHMDDMLSKGVWALHGLLLGVLHRYLTVLNLGMEAMKTGDEVDYQRFYQQQSDVCMLRLFDSFGESAPQLVFHLYVMIVKSHWSTEQATWTGMSAVASMVSLGWGVAAYSSAMRMIREDKGKMTWAGMILQTLWRFGMLTARIVAMVVLTLALDQWALILLFVHWLAMTAWVIYQDTDFCSNLWEERLYNAIVGVIYCFCFFNLKEGKSRYRASVFYLVIIIENFAFLAIFFYIKDSNDSFNYWFITTAFAVVMTSMVIGLTSMLLYYRFFHPAGPIRPCIGDSVDFKDDLAELKKAGNLNDTTHSPDFVVISEDSMQHNNAVPNRRKVAYSRSFKNACPPVKRSREASTASSNVNPEVEFAAQVASISPIISSRNYRERAIDCGSPITEIRIDSAYGTDSNGSPVIQKGPDSSHASSSGSSSVAFNNDTYMNLNKESKANSKSDDNTYMSVHVDSDKMLLKRSPVVRDVTSGFAQISSTMQLMKRKMTILVPANLEKTISLEALNPLSSKDTNNAHKNHDYENLALININRQPLTKSAVSHWRTYSNMADDGHDESCAYERQKYYDIYPLSRELKEKLYRSLTPLSTAATVASDSVNGSDATYEPIENYDNSYGPVTLIHHDGSKMSTRTITSIDSLREVIQKHEKVPMDDPQDRADLYILAPMRLLSPILEESSADTHTSEGLNKSLMTVISEILTQKPSTFPDGHFQDSIESTSSLVHTIEEIRNNSMCNLYYTTSKKELTSKNQAAPQVPRRNDKLKIDEEPRRNDKLKIDQDHEEEVKERRKKSPLYTSVGSRKNLLELAGTTNHILNTPKKLELNPTQLLEFDLSSLKPFENSHSLSPSAKYSDTPTPPLKANQFVRNAYRPARRKFSILRDKFELQDLPKPKPKVKQMIQARSNNDLYENISDDFLAIRTNSLREKLSKCKSVPSVVNNELLKADEQYGENFMQQQQRNQWSTASYQRPEISSRNRNARRSMSILDDYDKENCHPGLPRPKKPLPCMKQDPPVLRPKLRSIEVARGSPKAYRLSTGASLSPHSNIFNSKRS